MTSSALTSTANNHHCQAETVNGKPCRAAAGASGFCFLHDPALATERAQARRAGGRASKTPHSDATPPTKMGSLEDASAVLVYALQELAVHSNSIPRVRALIAIAQAGASLWQIGDFEQRLAALEAARVRA